MVAGERTIGEPEWPFAFFALMLHFPWEMLQAPLWVGMANVPHAQGVRACGVAALGDVMIALLAYWSAAVVARSRRWLLDPSCRTLLVYIVVGLVLTIGYEFLATEILRRWEYASAQPRVPLLGTGLAPLVQWMVLPPLTLWLSRVHLIGRSRRLAKRESARATFPPG